MIIPVAKARGPARVAPAAIKKTAPSSGLDTDNDIDIRCLISGQVPGDDNCANRGTDTGCQILYFADIGTYLGIIRIYLNPSFSIHVFNFVCISVDLGGTSGMAMRRSTASKGDAIINSLHALMDQLHRKVPGFHDASFNYNNLSWHHPENEGSSVVAQVSPSVLDCVFHDTQQTGPGGLSTEQTIELRALSVKTSDRLKNLYCNAVGLHGADEVELQRPLSPSMMRKTSVANRDDEFYNDVAYRTKSDDTYHPFTVAHHSSASPDTVQNHWTTFHEQDGITVSEFSNSDYPMDTLMASCHVEVRIWTISFLFLCYLNLHFTICFRRLHTKFAAC